MDDDDVPVDYEIEIPEDYESYGIPSSSGTGKDENDEQNKSRGIQYEGSSPHKNKPITNIEISPNGEYLVTYSKEDCSIAGWDVSDITGIGEDIRRLEPYSTIETVSNRVNQICISDDRKLAYIYNDSKFIGKQ